MKKMTVFTTAMTLTGLALISCGEDKKTEASRLEVYNSDSITKVENTRKSNQTNSDVVMTREYAMIDGTVIRYNTNDDMVTGLKDWENFNVLASEMKDIKQADYMTSRERLVNLNGTIENLDNSIPAWLKTEEVMEDVEDVQKEYRELINEKNASENERKENIEEVNEQVDDLKEELAETIQEYIDIHKDAIEEYNEEINDGDSVRDANEEYNEEIKDLKKVADYKEEK